MKNQKISQKIVFVIAIICYLASLACIGAVAYYGNQLGSDSPIVAAYSASIVFFLGCGIVLHVIGKADLPDLRHK